MNDLLDKKRAETIQAAEWVNKADAIIFISEW